MVKSHDSIKIICKNCGKEFDVPYRKRKQKFCSRSCVTVWKNVNLDLAKKAGTSSAKARRQIKISFELKTEENLNKKTFIYRLEYPVGNIRYVGKSDNPQKRIKSQIKEAKWRKNKNHRDNWLNSLSESPILNIVEEVPYFEWQARETYWIKFYKDLGFNLVNGTDGGEGSNGFKGRKHTKETKKKLSEYREGKTSSKETIDKISGENSSKCKLKDDEVRDVFYMFYEKKIVVQKSQKNIIYIKNMYLL